MIGLDVITTLAFFTLVGVLIVIDRKNIEFSYGVVLRRWNGGVERMDKLVNKHRKFFHYLGIFSIILGFLGGLVGIAYMIYAAITLTPSFGLVLPSVGGVKYPGPIVGVPFWYWIIAIFVILTTHESMHAVFARLANVPIKSYGIMLLLALPMGAFVDPDERKIRKLDLLSKLKIFSAGSFANFMTAIVAVLLVIATGLVVNASMQSAGVKFASTANDSPASAAGLDGIITSMDGVTINNIYDLSAQLARINPHDNVTITTTTGTFHMTTGTNPANQSLAYLGISDVTNAYKYRVFGGYVPNAIISIISAWDGLLFWILLISSGVGIVNMLPIMPLDGGRMYQEIFKKFFKRKANIISKIVSLAVLFVILFDIIGVWLLKTLA